MPELAKKNGLSDVPRLSVLYSTDMLNCVLSEALKQNKDDFIAFKANLLQEYVGRDLFNFMTIDVFRPVDEWDDDPNLGGAYYNVSPDIVDSYRRNIQFDHYTGLLFESIGSAAFRDAVLSDEEWKTEPINVNHCCHFDYFHIAQIAYAYPLQSMPNFVIALAKREEEPFPDWLTEEHVEYFMFPFFLCWLHVFNILDAATLGNWLKLLDGMTLQRFIALRALFEKNALSTPKLAESLNVSSGAIYRHIEGAYERLLNVEPLLEPEAGNINRLPEIIKAYGFFSLGPSSIRRKIPRRK